jgi:hypothetical protein
VLQRYLFNNLQRTSVHTLAAPSFTAHSHGLLAVSAALLEYHSGSTCVQLITPPPLLLGLVALTTETATARPVRAFLHHLQFAPLPPVAIYKEQRCSPAAAPQSSSRICVLVVVVVHGHAIVDRCFPAPALLPYSSGREQKDAPGRIPCHQELIGTSKQSHGSPIAHGPLASNELFRHYKNRRPRPSSQTAEPTLQPPIPYLSSIASVDDTTHREQLAVAFVGIHRQPWRPFPQTLQCRVGRGLRAQPIPRKALLQLTDTTIPFTHTPSSSSTLLLPTPARPAARP